MINIQYKLVSPKVIETYFSDIDIMKKDVLIKPEALSICKADMRYFFGLRDAKVLKQKLPLALIHEAVGKVLYDPTGEFIQGENVVLLPNIPGKDFRTEENYRLDSKFRSSKADGFMQEMICIPKTQVIKYNNIPVEIASFIEFISVGVHAITTYMKKRNNKARRIGVWGDGGLGYIISSLIKFYMPETEVIVVGTHKSKLELFQFVDETYTSDEINMETMWLDDVFECVGGQQSEGAIRQILDVIKPEGVITLLGVSEKPVAINTRVVLEKGLTLIGRSRSGRKDFEETIKILENNDKLKRRMKQLISEKIEIKSISDINLAFDKAKSVDFKIIMDWKI